MTTKALMYLSTCVIELLLFASSQHFVAYRVGGLVLVNSPPRRQNGNRAPLSLSRGGGGTLEIVVKHSTTLNVRYPHPIVASRAASGRDRHPQREITTTVLPPSSCISPSCARSPLASTMLAATSQTDNHWCRALRMVDVDND